jgi:hypothetical protein
MPILKESELQNLIIAWLRTQGIFCWRNNSTGVWDGSTYRSQNGVGHLNGVSDILGIFNGKLLAIEVKNSIGRVSEDQNEFIKNVLAHGGHAIVARDLNTVKEYIECLKKNRRV